MTKTRKGKRRNQVASQMESQPADAKEELFLELTSKNTTRSIKDFAPEGIRLESNLEGEAKGVRHLLRDDHHAGKARSNH